MTTLEAITRLEEFEAMKPMLSCGHAANATDGHGKPSCALCAGLLTSTPIAAPNLDGRLARCACKRTVPSTLDGSLAFFEFRGEGSRAATDTCGICGYAERAHDPERTLNHLHQSVVQLGKCTGFVARGAFEYDSYYCGCRGWD